MVHLAARLKPSPFKSYPPKKQRSQKPRCRYQPKLICPSNIIPAPAQSSGDHPYQGVRSQERYTGCVRLPRHHGLPPPQKLPPGAPLPLDHLSFGFSFAHKAHIQCGFATASRFACLRALTISSRENILPCRQQQTPAQPRRGGFHQESAARLRSTPDFQSLCLPSITSISRGRFRRPLNFIPSTPP